MADAGVIAALLSIPVTSAAAWWNKRSTERAADAAITAGRDQAAAALEAMQIQGRTGYELWLHTQLGEATKEFLRSTDALVHTVERLSDVELQQRGVLVREHAMAVEDSCASLELIAPPDLLPPARQLRARCRHLERVALDRTVIRSAIDALEAGWCPGNAQVGWCPGDVENCDHPRHGSAFVAWDLLTGWASRERQERARDRDLLDFCLRESGTMPETQVNRTLALADRCPASWNRLIGGWFRDPLMEGAASARDAFVAAARTATLNLSALAPS